MQEVDVLGETLASTCKIFAFDLMEIWLDNRCIRVHVNEAIKALQPESAEVYTIEDANNNNISYQLCLAASISNYVWHAQDDDQKDNPEGSPRYRSLLPLDIPIRTEISCKISRCFPSMSVYIVGYSMKCIKFKPPYLKFLSGIGFATCASLEESYPNGTIDAPNTNIIAAAVAVVAAESSSVNIAIEDGNRNRCMGIRSSWF